MRRAGERQNAAPRCKAARRGVQGAHHWRDHFTECRRSTVKDCPANSFENDGPTEPQLIATGASLVGWSKLFSAFRSSLASTSASALRAVALAPRRSTWIVRAAAPEFTTFRMM